MTAGDTLVTNSNTQTNGKRPKDPPDVPFNNVYLTGRELENIQEVFNARHLSANGSYSKQVSNWLETTLGTKRALLTTSGSAALEIAALLCDLKPGDEVILPSFTFVTTASAFVRSGAVPVFVDIARDTLCVDVEQIEDAITPKTRAIVPVHYAGVGCDMDRILQLAHEHQLRVVEDSSHGILARYKERYLGTIAPIGVLSFHETKNIVGGEAGALLINDETLVSKAQAKWAKGTNRHEFEAGLASKYTWTELGSAFAASEITAAVVFSQLQEAQSICARRLERWNRYHQLLASLEEAGHLTRPSVPAQHEHNGHIYYLLVQSEQIRDSLIKHLASVGVEVVFHYVPLHESPAGKRFGRCHKTLPNTESLSRCLLRLPLWPTLTDEQQEFVVSEISKFFE